MELEKLVQILCDLYRESLLLTPRRLVDESEPTPGLAQFLCEERQRIRRGDRSTVAADAVKLLGVEGDQLDAAEFDQLCLELQLELVRALSGATAPSSSPHRFVVERATLQ